MPEITVNGSIVDYLGQSPVVVVVRPEPGQMVVDKGHAVALAEALVVELTDRSPSVWTDGTGTTTVTASQQPSARPSRPEPMPDWDEASDQPPVEHRGRPDGLTLYRKPTCTSLGGRGTIAEREPVRVRYVLDVDGEQAVYEADLDQSELFRLLWPALRRADR